MKSVTKFTIKAFCEGAFSKRQDELTVEAPLEIRLSYNAAHGIFRQFRLTVTMRTPGDDKSLAIGFLIGEGIIHDTNDIQEITQKEENIILIQLNEKISIDVDATQRNFLTTSACGVCGKASIESLEYNTAYLPWKSKMKVNATVLCQLPDRLWNAQAIFSKTGGIHACGLFDNEGNIIHIKEDVGRHNALDKLIGSHAQFPISNYGIIVSGRLSFEMIQKASKVGVPIIVSIGAPSSLAIELAEAQGMTLIGFLKKNRFNIYTGEERVTNDHLPHQ